MSEYRRSRYNRDWDQEEPRERGRWGRERDFGRGERDYGEGQRGGMMGRGGEDYEYGEHGRGSGYGGEYGRGSDYEGQYGRGMMGRGGERDFGDEGEYGYEQRGYGNYGTYGRTGTSGSRFYQRPWEGQERGGMQQRGQYTGRGPKGYQRSDERIFEDACEILTRHGEIDASNMEVRVQNGEITLEGTVDSRRTKRMVEDVLEDVGGMREIHNHLRVQEGQGWRAWDQPGEQQQGQQEGQTRQQGQQRRTRQQQGSDS